MSPRLDLFQFRTLVAAMLLATTTACGGGGGDTTGPTPPPVTVAVASVELDRTSAALVPQGTVQLSATPRGANGAALAGRAVAWSSSASAVASVSASGLVTALASGTANITATSEGQSASASISVKDGAIVGPAGGVVLANNGNAKLTIPAGALSANTTITVTPVAPPTGPANIGSPVAGTVYELEPHGTTFAQPVTLEFKYPAVTDRSDSLQLLYGIRRLTDGKWTTLPGSSVNLATRTVRSTTSSFSSYGIAFRGNGIVPTISPSNAVLFWQESMQFTVDVRSGYGDLLQGAQIEWSQPPSMLVTQTGRATGLTPGPTLLTVFATYWLQCDPKPCQTEGYWNADGKTDSIPLRAQGQTSVTIALRPVATVNVTSPSGTMTAGQSQTLTANLIDIRGETLPMTYRTVTWSTSNASVASVSSTGDVTAIAPGTATISAVSEGVTGTRLLTVVGALTPVATVSVSPSEASVEIGSTLPLTATLRDAQGNLITGRTIAWSSVNTAIATVSASGVVTAVSAGQTAIIAQVEGKGAASTITVTRVGPLVTGSPRAGFGVTCLLRDNGAAASTTWCWGTNRDGARPDGGSTSTSTPTIAGGPYRDLAFGGSHSCAITLIGAAVCWGNNAVGQASGGSGGFVRVSAGNSHSCALDGGGAAWCWGWTDYTGDANTVGNTRTTPVSVAGAPTFVDIASGFSNTCAITAGGAAWCWGSTNEGAAGLGGTNFNGSREPRAVVGGGGFSSISGRDGHYCGLAGTSARCWGRNTHGQLGDGSTTNRNTPVTVQTSVAFKAVEAGSDFTCALATDGKAWCWGIGGALGTSSNLTGAVSTPVAVAGNHTFTEIAVGHEHACGRAVDGTWCWGFVGWGEQGNGDPVDGAFRKMLPVKVVFPQ